MNAIGVNINKEKQTMENYSLADIKAALGGEDAGIFGGNGFLWVILIFLFFLAFSGGFGWDRQEGMTQVERDVLTTSCSTQREVIESKYDTALQMAQLGYQNQLCCCDLKNAIHAEGEQTRALITENTIQSLRDALQSTQAVLNSSAQTQSIVNQLKPFPVPAYITCSPYATSNACYGGYGCGCGTLA